jgi:hypothetical protein
MVKTLLVDEILTRQLYNDLSAFAVAKQSESAKIGYDILNKSYEVKHYRTLYFELYLYNDMYVEPKTKIDYLYIVASLIRKKLGIDLDDIDDEYGFNFVI